MKRYIALLRGINVSGKNKISMSELKKGFVELGFAEVATYLNSGNVIFSSAVVDKEVLVNKVRLMIKDKLVVEDCQCECKGQDYNTDSKYSEKNSGSIK